MHSASSMGILRAEVKTGSLRRHGFEDLHLVVQGLHLAQAQAHGHAGAGPFVKKPPFAAHKHALLRQAYADHDVVFFRNDAGPPDFVALLAEVEQLPVARAEALHLAYGVQHGVRINLYVMLRLSCKRIKRC